MIFLYCDVVLRCLSGDVFGVEVINGIACLSDKRKPHGSKTEDGNENVVFQFSVTHNYQSGK